jgi:Winged helix DNA-binding domain
VQALRWSQVWQRRLAQQFLSQPAPCTQLRDVVRLMCGVHAQVQPSAELSLPIRVAGLTRHDVVEALWRQRSLVRTYGPRGTVHIFAADDLPLWLSALRARTPPRPAGKQELSALPSDRLPDLLHAMREALDGKYLSRAELAAELEQRLGTWATEETFPAFGGFLPRWQLALSSAANEGVLAFGPPRGNQVTYVRLDQWLPELPSVDGERALAEVFRRYLASYGPASQLEFARWFNMHPVAAKALQASLRDELEEVDVEGTRAWQLPSAEHRADGTHAHLLPQFDSYMVGCHPREHLIPGVAAERLGPRDTAAMFNVLLVDGVVSGLWERKRSSKLLEVRVDAFSKLSTAQWDQVVAQAERMAAFLGREADVSSGHVAPRGHL